MIVDGYAGAGGWDEGARQLGLTDIVGFDNWLDACRTAKAAGHARICTDVATYPTAPFAGRVRGAVFSPPCQPWSTAGKQLGKEDQQRVHALVARMAAGDDRWQDMTWEDDRSHHAAQPVRWVRDLRPEWVAFEQVPEVLPLWAHIGQVLRGWGYNAWVGKLCAADYGVPQTRTRAVLIASRVRRVGQPVATHYDPQAGYALFGQPWVSMGEALGWDGATMTQDRGAGMIERYGERPDRPMHQPAFTIRGSSKGSGTRLRWVMANGAQANATRRHLDEPAGTIFCSRPGNLRWQDGEQTRPVSLTEAAILQSFPADYPWHGNKTSTFLQVGNAVPPGLAAAVVAEATGIQARQMAVAA